MSLSRVILKKGKAGAALGMHPWVYDWMIDQVEDDIQDGSPVAVYADEQRFIAKGLWNRKGEIRIRLYSWTESDDLSLPWFERKLTDAIALRGLLGYSDPKGAARIVYGDADGLSGWVVDRYADYLVVQINASGLLRRMDEMIPMLAMKTNAKAVQIRLPDSLATERGRTYFAHGEAPAEPILVELEGQKFYVDLSSEQKTGFYLDQRRNRVAAARYAKGRSVVDLFSHSGGFGVHCAAAGARSVVCVDRSESALALAQKNASKNGHQQIETVTADAMEYLGQHSQKYGMVVLDPPKFAAGAASKEKAMAMYHRVNQTALGSLESGGIFVTSSCSGRIQTGDWLSMLASAARRAGRSLRMLELRGAAPDHPVALHCRESEYLKCAIFIAD